MFVLYHPKTRPTGKAIARAVGLPFGIKPPRDSGLIRWGSQVGWEHDSARPIVLNSAPAIGRSSDKLRTLELLKLRGIRVPFFTTDRLAAEDWLNDNEKGTIFGRSRKGMRGKDIKVFTGSPWAYDRIGADCDFYTAYVPNEREYRLHVVGENVVRIQRKYLDHPEQVSNPLVKNHANGYRFRSPQRQLNSDRLDLAVESVAALDLDFGAVDMVIDDEDRAWVLEVNSAPACSPMTVTAMAEAIASELNSTQPREIGWV